MSVDLMNEICGALPGAEASQPFGEGVQVWKVGEKIFASCFLDRGGVVVKCKDVATADMLKEVGVAIKAPYFHKSWVQLPLGSTDEDELRHRIVTSYDVIRASLTKKAQAALPARKT